MVYIGFSKNKSLLSRLLCFFTKAECSHCFFVFDLYGQGWVLQADWDGIVIDSLAKFQKRDDVVALAAVPELDDQDLAAAMQYLGDGYDYMGLLGGIFPLIGRWFKKKWNNPWSNSKALFCSEFVVAVLQNARFPGAEDLVPDQTTPQMLKDFLTEHYLNQEE